MRMKKYLADSIFRSERLSSGCRKQTCALAVDKWEPCSFGKLNILKKLVGAKVRRRSEEASHFHGFCSGVLEHVNASLWKEYCTSRMDRFDNSFDADPSRSAQKVNDLFAIRMRVSGAHCFAWLHNDHAHCAMVRASILLGYNPPQMAARKVEGFDIFLVNDR